jgi:hypothetical protein
MSITFTQSELYCLADSMKSQRDRMNSIFEAEHINREEVQDEIQNIQNKITKELNNRELLDKAFIILGRGRKNR